MVYTGPITNIFTLIDETHFPRYFRERVKSFNYAQATAVYLGLDKSVTDQRVAILLPNKTPSVCAQLTPPHGVLAPLKRYLLACTIPGEKYASRSDEAILEMVLDDLSDPFEGLREHVVWTKVLHIKDAVEAQNQAFSISSLIPTELRSRDCI